MFLSKLQALAEQQSPTLQELIHRTSIGDGTENAMDPDYLRGAFAVISEYYISGIDHGDIQFKDNYERGEFLWMLQLLVDYATGGKMEDLLVITPAVKEKIDELSDKAKKQS